MSLTPGPLACQEVAMTEILSETEALDMECYSTRDFLHLIAFVRDARPRDGLRALEDALLDMVGRAT